MYKITITKFIENPNYKTENEEYQKVSNLCRNYNDAPMPQEFWEVKALTTDLSDEEFQAVKKACLETM